MQFDVRYTRNDQIFEDVFEIEASTVWTGSRILKAAANFMDRKFGPKNYTLLRVKSHSKYATKLAQDVVRSVKKRERAR